MRSLRPIAALAALALALPAAGQVVSPGPEQTAVTIYRASGGPIEIEELGREDGLAMIRETRTLDLPAGRSRISFRGVVDTMIPQTAAVEGLPGAVAERNQDYDLLTPGALVEASVGQTVRLVRTNPRTGEVTSRPATLRAGAGGPVLEVDGRFEGLGCSGEPERLVFDRIPPNLADKPTFSVLADAPKAGRYQVQLSYLATGLGWRSDYVARIAPDGRSLDLIGWITLGNQTSASFAKAPTDVVAGRVVRDESETVAPTVRPQDLSTRCWPILHSRPAMAAPMERRVGIQDAPIGRHDIQELVVTGSIATHTDLGDYKLYTLPEPTTVASRQTKQVLFLEQKAVPFERVYVYRYDNGFADEDEEPVRAVLRLKNEKAAGLGKPLPLGVVAVMEPGPRGTAVLAGQATVRDTPIGLPMEVLLGEAMDVSVKVTVLEDEDAPGDRTVETIEAAFANDKSIPITLEYRQASSAEGFRLAGGSHPTGARNGDPTWTVRLNPGERKTLRYQVSHQD